MPGDSSSPVFVPVNDGTLKTVLFNSLASANGGQMYSDALPAITTVMQSLATAAGDATTYAPLTVSMTGFTTYP